MFREQWDSLIVPAELVAFRGADRWLVTNPPLASWLVLDGWEYELLRDLGAHLSLEQASHGACETSDLSGNEARVERTLAKLLLKKLVYLPGHVPVIEKPKVQLRQVYYAITEGCNLRRPYCYASAENSLPGELTTAESLDLVDQIADMGASELIFTGGEPMLRRDLFEIAGRSRTRGLRTNIITNGTIVKTPEIARKVADTFHLVTVSVDGGSAEVHEATRGKGTFRVLQKALRLLNEAGVEPKINHVVTPGNVDHMGEFANFLNGIQFHSVNLMNHGPLGRGATDGDDLAWIDYQKAHRFTWEDPRAEAFMPDGPELPPSCTIRGNCGLGGNEIYINSLGQVFPCKLVTEPKFKAGSVRQRPLWEIFDSDVLRDLRSNSTDEGENLLDCHKCYVRGICGGGCRAYHLGYTGNIKRNARNFCRVLRHSAVTSMWAASEVDPATLISEASTAYVPIRVSDGSIHEVYEDWRSSRTIALTPIS